MEGFREIMSTEDLVRSWKDPEFRQGGDAAHPAGDIRLAARSGLGRRAELLAGRVIGAQAVTADPWTTYTAP
jgi:hypothetical protein